MCVAIATFESRHMTSVLLLHCQQQEQDDCGKEGVLPAASCT